MIINHTKTKIMLFNTSHTKDFMPEMTINPGEFLEVVEEYKLLGVIFTSDLKWSKHISYMCKRAYSKLWILRRLKSVGASPDILVDMYIKYIRSILEYATPVWGLSLSQEDNENVERVQKCALSVIFGRLPYQEKLLCAKLETLNLRRLELVNKFAIKAAKHESFSKWFSENLHSANTRHKSTYTEVPARCDRWQNSPIPIMTKILNGNKKT